MEPAFVLEQEQLSARFLDLQKTYHPDRFVNEDAATRREAVQLAAHINQAFHTLSDPLERAQYLLEGISGAPDGADSKTSSDMEFLMRQMELREQLDSVSSLDQADALKSELSLEFSRLCDAFGAQYAARCSDEAANTLTQMKFYRRLQASLADVEAKLEDELF